MQAEHIPVHLGSMPDAVAAVLDERADARASLWILNDPFRGGTHLPDITLISPLLRRPAADRVRGQPRPPRRRRRPDPGRDARRFDDARGGGRRDPADAGDRRRARRARGADAGTGAAARRPARPACREPGRRKRRVAELVERLGARGDSPPAWRRSSTTPSAAAAPRSPGSRTATTRRPTCSRAAPTAAGTSSCACACAVAGDALELDFARQRRPGRGQPQLPARGDQVGGLLRRPRPDRPRRTALAPARTGRSRSLAPPGCVLNARSPAAVAAGNVETSSRVADLVLEALGSAHRAPAQGQGTMNNLTLAGLADGEGSPTTRRSAAVRAPARTPPGRARIHVAMSNTLNTPVEALEAECPVRVRELAAAARLAAARNARRRRRDRARDRGAGADALHADHRAPPPRAARARRRRRRGARAQPARRRAELPPKASGELGPGDRLRIETPGGGGGAPLSAPNSAGRAEDATLITNLALARLLL